MTRTWGRTSPVQQLLFRSPPIPGEALGSWISRLSYTNGFTHPWAFLYGYRILQNQILWPTACDGLLKDWLVAATGLAPMAIGVFDEDVLAQALGNGVRISGPARWLLRPTGVAKGFPGQRFSLCLQCLASDQTPYWRDEWRSATVTRCSVHETMMADRCASCGSFLSLFKSRKGDITQCGQCGESLLRQVVTVSKCEVGHWPAPLKILIEEMPVAVPHERLFWDGIWVLARHLCAAKNAQRLLRITIAQDRMGALLAELSQGAHGRHLEGMSVRNRHEILCFVRWLCTDWPERLVELFSQAKLTVATFAVRGVEMPYWLHHVVHDRLDRRCYWVGREEAEAAYKVVQRQSSRSRNKVKKILGVTESKSVGAVVQIYTRPFDEEDLHRLVHELQEMLRHTPSKRAQRAARVRDVLIIAMCALSRQSFSQVTRWSIDEFKTAWADAVTSTGVAGWHRLLIGVALVWLKEYEQEVRPVFCRDADSKRFDQFFLTRFGEPYFGMGLPGVLAKALARSRAPDVWRGVKLLHDLI